MSYETKPRWTGQGNRMCGLERMARHGPIRWGWANDREAALIPLFMLAAPIVAGLLMECF